MIRSTIVVAFLYIPCILTSGTVSAPEAGADTLKGAEPPVTVTEDQFSFKLDNGVVAAQIEKRTGNIVSLKYRDLDLLRHGRGYWSFVGGSFGFGRLSAFGSRRDYAVTIDPKANGGRRGEVSCKFGYVKDAAGNLPADVDMRYALGQGEHWIYVYSVWRHPAGYPAFSMGEARYAVKLNPEIFDYMTIDANRRRLMPSGEDWDKGVELNMKEVRRMTTGVHKGEVEHKYNYSAILAETPAYGWSSTKHGVGLWLINPSLEYIAGGPTKVELTAHLDCNPGGLPTLLNMWLGSHYGGSSFAIAKDEDWSKAVGPFLLYCNSGDGHDAIWKDALAHAAKESNKWPYAWVSDAQYPTASGRGTATGRIVISDPLDPKLRATNVQVGLAAPDYAPAAGRRSFGGFSDKVDWQRNAKHYQFWTRADSGGNFTIANVRPGVYTLHAIADGVLGEFSRENAKVAAGEKLDLGAIEWTPKRFGRTLWEIGVPDRSAAEFRHGDNYWQWGLYYEYPKEFPNDVNFIIGKSDPRRDWNYCQPPRIEGNKVTGSTWSITFDMPESPQGEAPARASEKPQSEAQASTGKQAVLRLGICGSAGNNVSVTLNDKPIGETGRLPQTGVMHWDGIRGYWCERDVAFDASLLKQGTNVLKLSFPAFSWRQGVLYDYLRLELADSEIEADTK
jgi:rhamnogalacturonan endolyase